MLNPPLVAQIGAAYAGLMSSFNRKIRDPELAADLINQAIVESLGKLAAQQIADPSRLGGFVYGVALNLWRNHRRRMDNRVAAVASGVPVDSLPSDASPFEQRHNVDVARHVHHVLGDLRPRDRELIRRFYFEDQCKADICREMGLSPVGFDKVAFKARGRMKRLLTARGLQRDDLLGERCFPDV